MLGHEVVKQGLHTYFTRHQWGNTVLSDFVGALNEAYLQLGNGALGNGFDLFEWCDQWLATSGVNIFEPVVEYREDGSIASLALLQTCDLRGKNRLRRHKADVAVYDEELNPYYIRDIIVDEK